MGPDENRILTLRLSNKMFHMFKHPEVNFILCVEYGILKIRRDLELKDIFPDKCLYSKCLF